MIEWLHCYALESFRGVLGAWYPTNNDTNKSSDPEWFWKRTALEILENSSEIMCGINCRVY